MDMLGTGYAETRRQIQVRFHASGREIAPGVQRINYATLTTARDEDGTTLYLWDTWLNEDRTIGQIGVMFRLPPNATGETEPRTFMIEGSEDDFHAWLTQKGYPLPVVEAH